MHHIFRVRGNEGATVRGFEKGIDDDLLGFKIVQIDYGDAGVGLIIKKDIASVIIAIGFGNGRVMGVTIGNVLALDPALGRDPFELYSYP
jgi:hypothetical protein